MSDLILCNAHVIAMDAACPGAELIAVEKSRISAVAKNEELRLFRDDKTEIIDCKGKTVVPGFIDAHCHLAGYAEALVSVDLSPGGGTKSLADMRNKVKIFCADRPPGTWVRGKGYNEFYLKEKRHPNRYDLDKAAPAHPVKLTHRSGHAHVLNSLALKLVGITSQSGDPPDGLIDRDLETGEPTGVLFGMGNYLAKRIPALDETEMKESVKRVNNELLSLGITSIQDATAHNDANNWSMLKQWKTDDVFKPAIVMMIGVRGFSQYKEQAYAKMDGLKTGGVKIVVHEITGDLNPPREMLNKLVFDIHQAGFQAVLHCIEEKTIAAACDAIEYALENSECTDHRHRIEHCSVCPPALAKRIGDLGIMVVTQPSFIYYSGDRYLETVPPEQRKDLYPIGRMIKNDIRVAGSSDFPIAKPNPLIGIYAAVTRMTEHGKAVLPEEGIKAIEALRMFTQTAAAASFDEHTKGNIAVGKNADLVVLSDDPTNVNPQMIKSISVEMTIINGEVVWRRE